MSSAVSGGLRRVRDSSRISNPSSLGRELLRHRGAQVGLILATLLVGVVIFAPLVTQNPDTTNYALTLAAPSKAHFLGTDDAGRDEFARVLAGARTTLGAAGLIFLIEFVIGLVVGLFSGLGGRVADAFGARVIDVLLGLPSLVVALAVVGALGPGFWNLVLAMSVTGWAYLGRLTRAHVLGALDRPDVVAARMAGGGGIRVATSHIVPGVVVHVFIAATMRLGDIIVGLAGLSFLGLGAQPPLAEWGQMLSDSRLYLGVAPWLAIGPSLGIMMSVAAATLVSDAVRDISDPSRRR